MPRIWRIGQQTDVIILPETAVGNSLYGDYVFVAATETANGKYALEAELPLVRA